MANNQLTNIAKGMRQSNFELLRILSMAGVLMNHTLQNLWNIHVPEITWDNECRIFLMNWAILAVNCFIMISGYFTIRLSWKGVVKYYAQCFFYMALFVCISAIIHHTLTLHDLSNVVFACSESNWFVRCYLALMLVSPLLNRGLQAMTQTELRIALILGLVIDVYIGYMHQARHIAAEGYELVHLATVYIIGYYISRTPVRRAPWGWWLLGMLVLMTVLHMVKMRFFPISVIYSLHYNSPCLMIASTLMFLWARTWTLQSKAVNWFAGGVFAVFLIHCNPYFDVYYWPWMKAIRDIGPWYVTPLLVTGASAIAFCVFALFDKLRARIFTPIELKIADKLSGCRVFA